jgi:enoyl-[acyl-carrier protein] reductase II
MSQMFQGNRVIAHTGARYPIFQAPMTWIARAPLVAAVSAAGGMGLLESSSADFAMTQREVAAIRAVTSAPFGVNLPVMFLKRNEAAEGQILDWIIANGIKFVTTSAGDPKRYTRRLKDAGLVVYHAVPSLELALKALDAGVDGLIVEGAEAAGIRNFEEVHSFVLLQAVRERVSVPIVAAGGIVDGRGMAAAFALGAEGVAMGTRFVASTESPVHPNYKAAIVNAPVTGTQMALRPPRAKHRVLHNERSRSADAASAGVYGEQHANVIADLYIGGDAANIQGSAGETAGLIHEVKGVTDIIDATVNGFWREIDRLAGLRLSR